MKSPAVVRNSGSYSESYAERIAEELREAVQMNKSAERHRLSYLPTDRRSGPKNRKYGAPTRRRPTEGQRCDYVRASCSEGGAGAEQVDLEDELHHRCTTGLSNSRLDMNRTEVAREDLGYTEKHLRSCQEVRSLAFLEGLACRVAGTWANPGDSTFRSWVRYGMTARRNDAG